MFLEFIFLSISLFLLISYLLFKWGLYISKEGIIIWWTDPSTQERKWYKF